MIGAGAAVVKEDRDAVGGGGRDEEREDCMEGWNVGGKKLGAVKG